MASMNADNITKRITGTHIDDHLNVHKRSLNDSWSFELLQEMYFYASTWLNFNISAPFASQNLPYIVNYTEIDGILMTSGINVYEFMEIFEVKLLDYLGFDLWPPGEFKPPKLQSF